MKATEARNLAEEKAPVLEKVLQNIKMNAENGQTAHFIMGLVITTELMQGLLGLGYNLREHTDPFNGMKGLVVSW